MHRLRIQAEQERQLAFEEEFKKNAKTVAIIRAKKDAAKLSGLQKLRAVERARRLENQNPETQPNALRKLSEYTQRNMARRDANLKRTQEVRAAAKEMKDQRLVKEQALRFQRMNRVREGINKSS